MAVAYPLRDLVGQFRQDVRAVSSELERTVLEASRGFDEQIASYFRSASGDLSLSGPAFAAARVPIPSFRREVELARSGLRQEGLAAMIRSPGKHTLPRNNSLEPCESPSKRHRTSGAPGRSASVPPGGNVKLSEVAQVATPFGTQARAVGKNVLAKVKLFENTQQASQPGGLRTCASATDCAAGVPAAPPARPRAATADHQLSGAAPQADAQPLLTSTAGQPEPAPRAPPSYAPHDADLRHLSSASPRPGGGADLLDSMRTSGEKAQREHEKLHQLPDDSATFVQVTPRLADLVGWASELPPTPAGGHESVSVIEADAHDPSCGSHSELLAISKQLGQVLPQGSTSAASMAATVTPAAPKAKAKGKSARRSACCVLPESPKKASPQASPRGSPQHGESRSGKQWPKVPCFAQPEPWQLYRQLETGPKRAEDNYEISERDESEENEGELAEQDQADKHVPSWVGTYLETLSSQSALDPDTIFSARVPRCELEAIFSDELYARCSLARPKRVRGSSGEWKKDGLGQDEAKQYKTKMGQTETWTLGTR